MDFVEEFKKLLFKTPTYGLRSPNNTNCPYAHMVTHSKNIYLSFSGYKGIDSGYSHNFIEIEDCYDTFFCTKCQLCYECVSCEGCYNCTYCTECVNCSDVEFSYDCRGCTNCFGCVGLRQREYYLFNEKLTKEAYIQKVYQLNGRIREGNGRREIEEKVEALLMAHPHLFSVQMNTQNCTGDHIVNSKNCWWSFGAHNSQDAGYIFHNDHLKDCYDTDYVSNGELLYECNVGYEMYNCDFCFEIGNIKDSSLCVRCFNSQNLFGCVFRNHTQFEILNEKYEKEEYFKKTAEIKDQLRAEKKYVNFLPEIAGIYT